MWSLETDRHNRYVEEVDLGVEEESFYMDVYTVSSLMPGDAVSIEHDDAGALDVIDDQKELDIITGIAAAHRRRNHVRAISCLLDQLALLEVADRLIPACEREYDF